MGRGMIDPEAPELPERGFADAERMQRYKAMAALEMMKRLEREKRGTMRTVRLDSRTVVTATEERMEEIIKDNERRMSGRINNDDV